MPLQAPVYCRTQRSLIGTRDDRLATLSLWTMPNGRGERSHQRNRVTSRCRPTPTANDPPPGPGAAVYRMNVAASHVAGGSGAARPAFLDGYGPSAPGLHGREMTSVTTKGAIRDRSNHAFEAPAMHTNRVPSPDQPGDPKKAGAEEPHCSRFRNRLPVCGG
jgi:hypothetical protein